MPKRSDLPHNASRLLTLLCALPEEAQYALLALLGSNETANSATRGPDVNSLQTSQALDQEQQPSISSTERQDRPLPVPLRTTQLPDARDYLKLRQRVRKLETTLTSLQALLAREEWLPRRLFLERYPSITEGRLKHLLLERERNGLTESGALRQSGPRSPIFICPARFWKWFEER
jgi:hypothetical protein